MSALCQYVLECDEVNNRENVKILSLNHMQTDVASQKVF